MDNNMINCLYGTYASQKHIVGYCWKHHGAITVKQLKCKQCLKKQCNALEKYESHEYWHQRMVIKQKRIEKRERKVY